MCRASIVYYRNELLGGSGTVGWCSGTSIFDGVMKYLLVDSNLSEATKLSLIRELVISLEDQDWDCQSSSDYWNDPLVQKVFVELHPDWFSEE